MAYPEWWQSGAMVTARNGSRGTLAQLPDGTWRVGFLNSNSYVVNPSPSDWFAERKLEVTPMQVRRMVYEADRALLMCFGRGGLLEWASVPESVRAAAEPPRPTPLHDDGLLAVRVQLAHAIEGAFLPYLD